MTVNDWVYQDSISGSLGSDVTITLSVGSSQKRVHKVRVNAPLADSDATVKIYKDSSTTSNLVYSGYIVDKNVDGDYEFPDGFTVGTSVIVLVENGTGSIYVSARYR